MTLSIPPADYDQLVVARGPNLILRHRLREDAIDEFAWQRDPETARLNGQPPAPPSFARFLQTFENEMHLAGHGRDAFAIDTATREHIGTIMYYNAESGESAELGITIGHARHRGRGFGREAVVLFLRHLFASHPFREIYLHTLEHNTAAHRAFAAAGFNPTVTILRHNHRYIRMQTRREWWLLWDMEGRFAYTDPPPQRPDARPSTFTPLSPGE